MTDSPTPRRDLAGRGGEAAALTRALHAADSGHPAMLLVVGEAGIGKTALVGHVVATACAQVSRSVRRVAGVAWESALPFGVAAQLLRTGDLAPSRLSGPAPAQAVLDTGRRLHEQWTALQREHTLVVVVEDAHWADVDSLRAMRSAVRRMTDEKILVLLIARKQPEDVPGTSLVPAPVLRTLEFLDALHDDAVRPGPLGPDEVRALARETCGLTLDLPTARRLARHTRGNPRHILALLHELPDRTWHEWCPDLPAPARYTAAVRHWLEECEPTVRLLAEACSVLGAQALLDQAAALADLDDPMPALDVARESGLLVVTVDPGHLRLSFVHPLVRAAVLTGMSLARRATLHRRAAALSGDTGRRLDHRSEAAATVDADLAEELDQYAAGRAAAGEWSTVADVLVRASRLSPQRAAREDRLLRAVDAMIGAGDVPQAAAFAAELESLPPGTLRDVVLGYLAIMRGRPAEAETHLNQAEEQAGTQPRPDLTARICQRRVLHALGRWDGPQLVTWARRAVELADPSDPSVVESKAILGLGLAAMGRPQEAVEAYAAAESELPQGAQPQRFQLGRGWVDLAQDAPEAARRRLETAVPTGYRMGSTRISLWAQGWLARTQFALGAWTEAIETVQHAAARLDDVRIELVRPLIHWTGAQIHALRGDWETAEEHCRQAAAAINHYEVMLVPACLARAQVNEARGDYRGVIEALTPILELPTRASIDEPGFWPWADVYANALVMTGDLEEADTFLAPHEELALRRNHRSTRARLGLARGRLSAARGDIEAARQSFEISLAHLHQLPLPYDRARVNFAYGQSLRRAGKRRDADAVLRNARDAYHALGARTYVDRCDREVKAGGLLAGRAAPSAAAQLTPQEQAVAQLVASGATNSQTAAELYISVKTVQYHLTRLYAKLGVRSRTELAAHFRETAPPT
ncbi:AAA family ATPase [Streptomyces sp. NPDC056296]|uniref:helix-turn-helix transcriptional regulator n=1 Tax=Streptomyces sp. NPDC056296 TaxID=3345775 RepID=UPI0035DFB2D4